MQDDMEFNKIGGNKNEIEKGVVAKFEYIGLNFI
jgi:hypothetical protein